MTPIRMVDGLPQQGERPVVLVAARWPGDVPTAQVRPLAQDWASLGLTGIACGADAAAADAARRAGLMAIVSPELAGDAPHLLVEAPEQFQAADSAAAFGAALAGGRFVVGEYDDVAPLALFLAVADADDPWTALPAQGDWCLAGAGELVAAYTSVGGDVELSVAEGQSLHWVDPTDGAPLAISTPSPDEHHTVRVPEGTPMALLLAPSRFVPADVDALD